MESSSSSSLVSRSGSPSYHDEQEVDVSFARRLEEAFELGITSEVGVRGCPEPDHRDDCRGLERELLLNCPVLASFFNRFSLALLFWNQT